MRTIVDLFACDQAVRTASDFIGRETFIGELLDCVHSANCVQVVGPRRIGKSSLLLHLTRASTLQRRPELIDSNLLVYINLQAMGTPNEEAFWGQTLSAIKARLLDMHNPSSEDTPPLLHHQDAIQNWAASVPTHASEKLTYSQATELLEDLKNIGLGRMTLLLDELEVLGQIPTQRNLTQRLRALAGDPHFPVTFVTASRLPIAQLTEDGTLSASPFFNIFSQTIRIGPFSEAELHDLIRLPERLLRAGMLSQWQEGLSLSPHQTWIEYIGGHHPFYSTVACRRLLRLMAEPLHNGLPPKVLTGDALKALKRDLEDDLSGQVIAAIQDRSHVEQTLLVSISQGLHGDGQSESDAIQPLVDAALLQMKLGVPQIASQLVFAHLKAPAPPPTWWKKNHRRVLGLLALIGAAISAAVVGNHLYGPLPRSVSSLELGKRAIIKVSYPQEVRVEEVETIEIDLDAIGGQEGRIQVSIISEGGGFTFPDQEVQHIFELKTGLPLHQVWSTKILPHAMGRSDHKLKVRAHWLPIFGNASTTDPMVLMVTSRALAGVKVVVSSAATVLLAVLGFLGLNMRGITDWVIDTFRRNKSSK